MPKQSQHPIALAAAELVRRLDTHNTRDTRADPVFLDVVVAAVQQVNDAGTAILEGCSAKVYAQRHHGQQRRRPSSVDEDADTEFDGDAVDTLTTADEGVDNGDE